MLRKTYLLVLTLFAGLYATTSSAQIFDIQVTDYGSIPAGALRTFVDQQIQTAENSINKDFPSGAPDRLMEGMANSSVMATGATAKGATAAAFPSLALSAFASFSSGFLVAIFFPCLL